MVLHRERGVSEEPAHMATAGGAGAKEGRGPKRAPRAHGLAGKRPVVAACPPIRPQVVRNPSPNILLRKIKDRDGEAAVVASGHLQSDFMADAGVVNGRASTARPVGKPRFESRGAAAIPSRAGAGPQRRQTDLLRPRQQYPAAAPDTSHRPRDKGRRQGR